MEIKQEPESDVENEKRPKKASIKPKLAIINEEINENDAIVILDPVDMVEPESSSSISEVQDLVKTNQTLNKNSKRSTAKKQVENMSEEELSSDSSSGKVYDPKKNRKQTIKSTKKKKEKIQQTLKKKKKSKFKIS